MAGETTSTYAPVLKESYGGTPPRKKRGILYSMLRRAKRTKPIVNLVNTGRR